MLAGEPGSISASEYLPSAQMMRSVLDGAEFLAD
jgi:hypothetical protein